MRGHSPFLTHPIELRKAEKACAVDVDGDDLNRLRDASGRTSGYLAISVSSKGSVTVEEKVVTTLQASTFDGVTVTVTRPKTENHPCIANSDSESILQRTGEPRLMRSTS